MRKYSIIILSILLWSCSSNNIQETKALAFCGAHPIEEASEKTSVDILGITSLYVEKGVVEPKLKISKDSLLSMIEYLEIASHAGVQGIVVINFIVDKDGNPKRIKLKHGLGAGLDEIIINASKHSTFEPASLNGEKIEKELVGLVRFKIYNKYKN